MIDNRWKIDVEISFNKKELIFCYLWSRNVMYNLVIVIKLLINPCQL